jgi:hypothetical protein
VVPSSAIDYLPSEVECTILNPELLVLEASLHKNVDGGPPSPKLPYTNQPPMVTGPVSGVSKYTHYNDSNHRLSIVTFPPPRPNLVLVNGVLGLHPI